MNGIIRNFIDKNLSLLRLGENYLNKLVAGLIEAGRTISYIETYNPVQSDLFHKEIKYSDKKLFMKSFEELTRKLLPKLKLENVKVAFDTTEDLTWIKPHHSLRPSTKKHELQSWQFLNLSIVEPYFIPLMSIPYTMLDNLDYLVMNLVGYLESLTLNVKLILFDRGFYHAHLIDFLNSKNLPYLMLVPRTSTVKSYIEQTKYFKSFQHKFIYTKEKSEWETYTTIIVRRIDENICWSYATNQKPCLWLTRQYKKRWNIETGFRIHDEVKIKSKSKNILIRFFYHLLGMLIVFIWRLELTKRKIVFKRFLREMEKFYSTRIIIPPPPPL